MGTHVGNAVEPNQESGAFQASIWDTRRPLLTSRRLRIRRSLIAVQLTKYPRKIPVHDEFHRVRVVVDEDRVERSAAGTFTAMPHSRDDDL
jgi:hypothetical protein